MKRAVIFLHGFKPSVQTVRATVRPDDCIICADGGTQYALDLGVRPTIAIGDFDSLSKDTYSALAQKGIAVHQFSTNKDETDSELAIQYAVNHGIHNLIIFGLLGNRIDHLFSNITYLTTLSPDVSICLVDDVSTSYIVHHIITLSGKPGDYISLVPIKENVTGVTTNNLKWKLKNATLTFGSPRGISNELIKKPATITIKSGTLLVVYTPR